MTTEAEVIEGTALEVVRDERPLAQPGNSLVARPQDGPSSMIATATALASALKDVVDRQQLYTTIQGKRYPQVEAWMTIGRMDNVVAREAERPIRNDDGSYEAFVELVRLSDGMVIGRASALCGMADDEPWGGTSAKYGKPAKPPRAEYARRSMAVTRATSRAFRQQYSWIMALAGYEPTPADEMPQDARDVTPTRVAAPDKRDDGGLVGTVEVGKARDSDYELRETPEGWALGFRLKSGRGGIKVIAKDAAALALAAAKDETVGQRVICWGRIHDETFTPAKSDRKVTYQVLTLERIQAPGFVFPASPDVTAATETPADAPEVAEAPSAELFELTEDERAAVGAGLPDA